MIVEFFCVVILFVGFLMVLWVYGFFVVLD